MRIETLILGKLKTNCYILKMGKDCIVIDPADEYEKIQKAIGGYNLLTILVTHQHFDHIGALNKLITKYNVPINDFSKIRNMSVINTPGHTKDSISFYFPEEKVLFCGDFLFQGSFGRTDLGGNNQDMIKSLNKIEKYPDDIIVYPGHGKESILKVEKLNFNDYKVFLKI